MRFERHFVPTAEGPTYRTLSFAGIILAAGASSRMGRDKALLPWRGGTFLSGHIEALQLHTDFVIVVAGKNRPALQPVIESTGASIAENPGPERGQFSSLQLGLQEALRRACDVAIISLVDHPPVRLETVALLRRSYEESPEPVWAVAPEYSGRHGHPIVVGREMIDAFLAAPATGTAREVQSTHRDHIIYVSVDDHFTIQNIDTPEDYARIAEG